MARQPRKISEGLQWALIIVPITIGMGILSGTKLREIPYMIAGLIVIAGLTVAYGWYQDRKAACAGLAHALIVPDDGGLLITDERISEVVWHARRSPAAHRLKARRLRDGAEVSCLAGPLALRLLGAAPEFLWCSSEDLPVHARDPRTFAVVHDEAAILRAQAGPALKRLDGDHDPVFDTRSRGVHAYRADGRGVLITPDLAIAACARDAITEPAGEQRFAAGRLALTDLIDGSADAPPTLTFRRAGPNDRTDDALAYVSGDGAVRWEAKFPDKMLIRGTHLFVTADRVVVLFGMEYPDAWHTNWRARRLSDSAERAIGLDRATGEIRWRVRF
jgi:hypothetical protein